MNFMKVLIFMTQFYQLGGAERLAVELAEDLNKRGIKADILSMYSENLSGVAEAKQELLNRGIPNVYFLDMKIHPSIASLFLAVLRLRKLIRDGGYDIVETSLVSPSVIASWATLMGKVSFVAGLHQVFLKTRDTSLQHKIWRLSAMCNRHIRFYAISDFVGKAWALYSGVKDQRIRKIFNAIPDATYDVTSEQGGLRNELALSADCKIVLYVGRLTKSKGCDTLLEALIPCLMQENVALVYVGDLDPSVPGSNEMLDGMRKQIADRKLEDRVHFLGFRNDIPHLMASSNVLAHPTLAEGFGLTLVEALAVGLPVVASDVDGIPEVLKGTDAIMFPPNDAPALYKAILKILNNTQEETIRIVQKGKKRAADFRITRRTDEMIRFYEDVRIGKI